MVEEAHAVEVAIVLPVLIEAESEGWHVCKDAKDETKKYMSR